MKARLFICLVLLLFCSPISAQETYPGGIVYGPKAAFNIAATEGWVLDNTSGAEQGLPCAPLPEGFIMGGRENDHVCKDCRHSI